MLSQGGPGVQGSNGSQLFTHGRAPLAEQAADAAARAGPHYSDLEYDLARGERGTRQAHVEGLLRELSGAEAGFAVNNGAAAVLLAAAALAAGRQIVVPGRMATC